MEILIKLDKRLYEYAKHHTLTSDEIDEICDLIAAGTILPKGHGRIGDLDKLIRNMKERNDDNGGEPLNAVDRGYNLAYQHMVKEAKECVFIEAADTKE